MRLIGTWSLSSVVLAAVFFLIALAAQADAPFVDPAEDHLHFGSPDNVLFWTPKQQVAGFRNSDRLSPTRPIAASRAPLELPYALEELGDVVVRLDDVTMTVDEYFRERAVAGLLVVKDGTVVYERYGLGNTASTPWISFSVAKSVVSMLIGAAIQDGYIESVDEKSLTICRA